MSYQRYKTVVFGRSKTGLATVGYTVQGGSRIQTGVSEVKPGTGIYAAIVTFPSNYQGPLVWDTGEATPAYAVEEINPGSDEYLDSAVSTHLMNPSTGNERVILW